MIGMCRVYPEATVIAEQLSTHERLQERCRRSFASMLSAMAVCGSLYAVLAFNLEMTVIYYISLIILFMIQFVLFRKFIFREKELKAVFDRVKKKSLFLSRVFSVPEQKISLLQILQQ